MARSSTGIDSDVLVNLDNKSGYAELLQQEFKFLKKFISCLKCVEDKGDISFTSAIANLHEVICTLINENQGEDLESVSDTLLNKFKQLEREVASCCIDLFKSLRSMSYTSDEILEVVDCVIENLQDLSNLKAFIAVSLKNRIVVLGRNLSVLRTLVHFSHVKCIDHQMRGNLLNYTKKLAYKAGVLSLLGFLKGEDEMMSRGLETMFSHYLQKFMRYTPEFTGPGSSSSKFEVVQVVVSLVEFLVEGSADHSVEICKEGLIFIISFCIDPLYPKEEAVTNVGYGQIEVAINEVLSFIFSLCTNQLEVDLSSLLVKIDKLKLEIGKLYTPALNASNFNFPMTSGMGFINFMLENLMEMVNRNPSRIAFAKHRIMIIHEKILSLKPFLEIIMQLQEETGDLKDLWKLIINTMFLTEHVIKSCLIIDHPVWYNLLQLSDVTEAIKLIQIEVKKYSAKMHYTGMSSIVTNSALVITRQATSPKLEDVVVGLEDESNTIIEKFIRGTTHLGIVSIVGMPGLGKTTMAKKVYNDLSVRYYFHIRAWCCVSQVYDLRELYLDLLSDVIHDDARKHYSNSTEEELANILRKKLKEQKYLVVLDDIWSIEAWEKMKSSFPDDINGSRIIFTSRIDNLVSQEKLNCSHHALRSLTSEESWQLLERKLFLQHSFPLDAEISEIGKIIAQNCKGLPLSVVLIAGILAGKDKEFWKEVESRTSSQVVSEGCMDVLELSYKNLPDNLKPCFLYFGAYQEDKVVRAQKLMSLWIAEGMIPRTEGKSPLEVAEDYLFDLISRNLVILQKRSSIGGIKTCRVHDLLHELCSVKIREDNFLQRVQGIDVSHSPSSSSKYQSSRLCIYESQWDNFVETKPAGPFVHSLLYFGGWEKVSRHVTIFNRFRSLNVLNLYGVKIKGHFPGEVTFMVHLRYLAISCDCSVVTELPESIANLWNLEFLIAYGVEVNCLPKSFWQMKSLRQVHLDGKVLGNPKEDGQLKNLEILSLLNLATETEMKEVVRRFPNLRKLKFRIELCAFVELRDLTRLESLTMLPGYSELWRGIQFSGFDLPSSLRKLTLQGLGLAWSCVSTIQRLPKLESLKLLMMGLKVKRWDLEDGTFFSLKYLKLQYLPIQEWTVQDEPFPSLERLVVDNCRKLRGIPSGFRNIPTLKKIEIHNCDLASKSAWKILEEQREMGNNELQVFVSHR